MLLLQLDVLNTSRHLVYFKISHSKAGIMEFYDEWLAFEVHYDIEAANKKPTSRHLIVTWILEA